MYLRLSVISFERVVLFSPAIFGRYLNFIFTIPLIDEHLVYNYLYVGSSISFFSHFPDSILSNHFYHETRGGSRIYLREKIFFFICEKCILSAAEE